MNGDLSGGAPDPGRAATIDDVVTSLRALKVWAGDPSYEVIRGRVDEAWQAAGRPAAEAARRTTIADCFKTGRRRLNADLVIAIVRALHPEPGYQAQWQQALRVVAGEAGASAQVRVLDELPAPLPGFTGRVAEIDRLRAASSAVAAISGMAGVGKTQLAVRVGHALAADKPFDRVLFVNLRGFHPDPSQPPADPDAVLDGFLRVLGLPGHRVPHDRPGRLAAYRELLAGRRVLVVLDNAADADQARPLLPETAGCLAIVTSRRLLTGLGGTQLTLDVFTPPEAVALVTGAPVGDDPLAAERIARRCGYLPLALGLVVGQIRARPGWTLTDHADRLDDRRLETGVGLALDLSYQHLSPDRQRLLRRLALHPGQDLDAYAAAALAGSDLDATRADLRRLYEDQLIQSSGPDRYVLHDLVRDHAAARSLDEDSRAERHAARTRLFDLYLATAATAVETLFPAEAPAAAPVGAPGPAVSEPGAARDWLDAERPALVAVAGHAAVNGWPEHATRLSTVLLRYLDGGHHGDALAVHDAARRAAQQAGDRPAEAGALINLGSAHRQLGRYAPAAEAYQQALVLFHAAGDHTGEARTLGNLALVEERLGRYRPAAEYSARAIELFRLTGNRAGEARALINLGIVEGRLGRHQPAADHLGEALTHYRTAEDRVGEATTLLNLGEVEQRRGATGPAAEHLDLALRLFRELGSPGGEAWTLAALGALEAHLGRPIPSADAYRQALGHFRDSGDLAGEACARNGLGEAARAGGQAVEALDHHHAAYDIATTIGVPDELARAHAGLGHAHRVLDDREQADHHLRHALALYSDLGLPEAARMSELLGS